MGIKAVKHCTFQYILVDYYEKPADNYLWILILVYRIKIETLLWPTRCS